MFFDWIDAVCFPMVFFDAHSNFCGFLVVVIGFTPYPLDTYRKTTGTTHAKCVCKKHLRTQAVVRTVWVTQVVVPRFFVVVGTLTNTYLVVFYMCSV